MKRVLFLVLISAIVSCGEKDTNTESEFDARSTIEKIEKLESELISPKNKAMNLGTAQDVIVAYKEYANNLPLDARSPEYLFKAADVEMGLQHYKKAEVLYKRVYDNYHNYEKRVMCLYLVAFVNDNHLDQKGKAKTLYEELIERHPDDKLAQDAIAALDILTLSDEELIEFLKNKNQSTDSIQ